MEEKAKNFRFFLIFTEKSRKKRSKKRQSTESRALPFRHFKMTFTQNPLPQRQSGREITCFPAYISEPYPVCAS